jgi:hypothetical protein
MSVPPFKGSWWVVGGELLAGPVPMDPAGSSELVKLLDYGVKAFVDLRDPNEGYGGEPVSQYREKLPAGVSYENFPIIDGHAPETIGEVDRIVSCVDALVREPRMTYVHCHGGHGRTGLIVACWLVLHGRTAKEALAEVVRLRGVASSFLRHIRSPQTPMQIKAVRSFENFLRGEGRFCARPANHGDEVSADVGAGDGD